MTVKELLLKEIESLPDSLLTETLEFVQELKSKKSATLKKNSENLGYPPGFFERTYGCLAEDPLVRYPQGEPQERNWGKILIE